MSNQLFGICDCIAIAGSTVSRETAARCSGRTYFRSIVFHIHRSR